MERAVVVSMSAALLLNYARLFQCRRLEVGGVAWQQALPLQLCDWGMVVVIVALWTGNRRWFEVAYFWGMGGTLAGHPHAQSCVLDFPIFASLVFSCRTAVSSSV